MDTRTNWMFAILISIVQLALLLILVNWGLNRFSEESLQSSIKLVQEANQSMAENLVDCVANEHLRDKTIDSADHIRLTDIVDEAESRLSSVRNQAAKAAKYREIRAEFQGLWVGLAADEYRRTSARLAILGAETTSLNGSIETITADQEKLEAERIDAEAALTKVEEQLRERERGRSELQSRITSLRTTIRHERSRLEELDQEFERLCSQRTLLKSRTQEAAAELNRTRTVLDNEQKSVAELEQQLRSAEENLSGFELQIAQSQDSLKSDRDNLMQQFRKNSTLESKVSTAKQSLEQANNEILKLDEEQSGLQQLIAKCLSKFEAKQQEVTGLEADLAAADDDVQAIRAEREAVLTEQAELQGQLTSLRNEQTSAEARLSVLEDLERRQEGLRIGTREILKRAASEHHEPWASIVGSVTDLLDVELDKAALLEVALADRAQLIVIREMDAFIEYINNGRCHLEGRVGFVSLEDIRNSQFMSSPWRPADAELPNLTDENGIVCPAAELARCSDKTPRLAKHLLGDTWIVETLNDAIYLSDKTQRKCRFVTLQGELVESDGTLFAGIELSASSVLTRRSELRRLQGDIDLFEKQIERKQVECEKVAAKLDDVEVRLNAALEQTQSRSDQLRDLKSNFTTITHERERLETQQSDLQTRRDGLTEKNGLFSTEIDGSQGLLTAGLGLVARLQQSVADSEETLASSKQRVESLTSERNKAEVALGKQQERFNTLREGMERLETDVQQRELQQEEAERRAEEGTERRREIRFHILEATSELAQLHLDSDQALTTIRDEAKEEKQLKSERSGVAARESQLATQRRELATRLHSLEMESGTIRNQLTNTESRIEEEFQFPLADAVRTGVSAMAAHVIPPFETNDNTEEEVEDSAEPESNAEVEESDETEPEDSIDASVNEAQQNLNAVEQLEDEEFEQLRDELEERVERLRRRLRNMGNVGTESLENLEEIEGRFGGLSHQLQDLIHARDTLEAIIRRINSESKRLFAETFESIRGHFKDLFRKLFGGGEGDVILEDPDNVLECGIDIVARPPGKELRSISLLSGGEKTMTAVALLLAIFRSRPSPFCILDEVDAALDEANVDRFVQVLREFQETTQFIMITHRKPSMSVCDLIFGVTMEESGVSKRLTVRFDDVNEDGEFDVSGSSRDAA